MGTFSRYKSPLSLWIPGIFIANIKKPYPIERAFIQYRTSCSLFGSGIQEYESPLSPSWKSYSGNFRKGAAAFDREIPPTYSYKMGQSPFPSANLLRNQKVESRIGPKVTPPNFTLWTPIKMEIFYFVYGH